MHTLAKLGLGAILSVSGLGTVSGQEYTMKFSTAAASDPTFQFMIFYEEELERLSEGRIEVELFPQSQLGPIPRQIEGVQLGTIEAFAGPTDFFAGIDPRFGVLATPMLFRDNAHAAATVTDPAINRTLLDLGTGRGFVGLGLTLVGMVNYVATDPILSIDDFNGKKLRINGSDMERERFARLGATSIPLPLGEVLPALQRGGIDGTGSAMSVFVAFGFRDAVDTVTVLNDTVVVSVAVVSEVWFNGLPDDLKQDVLEAGQAAQARMVPWQQEFVQGLDAQWEERGGKIVTLSSEDQAELQTLLGTVGDDIAAGNAEVKALLDDVRAAAANH